MMGSTAGERGGVKTSIGRHSHHHNNKHGEETAARLVNRFITHLTTSANDIK